MQHDMFSGGLFIAATDSHVSVEVFVVIPLFGVHTVDFGVNKVLVGLWYGAVSDLLACFAKLKVNKLVCSFIAPESGVGSYSPQFYFVACSNAVDN